MYTLKGYRTSYTIEVKPEIEVNDMGNGCIRFTATLNDHLVVHQTPIYEIK